MRNNNKKLNLNILFHSRNFTKLVVQLTLGGTTAPWTVPAEAMVSEQWVSVVMLSKSQISSSVLSAIDAPFILEGDLLEKSMIRLI